MPALVEDLIEDTGKATAGTIITDSTVTAVDTASMAAITVRATVPAGNKLQPAA
jgi:hypothetical protein